MSTKFQHEEKSALDFLVYGKDGESLWNSPEENVQLLNSSECENMFCTFLKNKAVEDETLDILIQKSVRLYIEDEHIEKKVLVASVGVASLQLFVQSNWLGPPLSVDLKFPWITESLSEILSESKVVDSLILDGESCYSTVRHPLLLLLAREALLVCTQDDTLVPGIKWWWQRCMFIHQQVLDEFSVSLHNALMTVLKEMVGGDYTTLHSQSWAIYHLEAAQIYLYYSQVVPAREQLDAAAQKCKLDMELMGALGKRTKFQEKAVAQLMLKVSVDRKYSIPSVRPELLPKDLSLNDEVRLNKVQFLDEADGQFPLLTPLEQAVVLGTFVYTQKAQPKDKLSEEELLPYLSCILTSPQSWSLQMAALLFRCRLESNSSRTVERSMMQAQELVDCLEAAEPSVAARASNLFNSYLPPHWRIQADLANLLLSLGSVKSALNIYLQLDLWEDVIRCYNILEQRHLAAEIIRQKLNAGETVKLWCLLGDATDDVSCYERGWELSKQKSGRAQRHWALYYFRRRCYAESIPHFQASLALNSLQVTLWFQFGFACLDQEKWELCATAYRRYCTLDPENFEAWNNLAKAYAKMGQKARAWKALQEAVKCNYENWQVWDNLLVVSTDCGEFEEVIHSYHRILDLKKRHLDLEVLKILVNAVASDLPDNRGIPAGRHKKNALALFGRLTGQITNDTLLWKLYAQLTASAPEQTPETLHKTVQYLQKAHRCAVQSQHWARDVAHCKNVADLCVNLANACMECCKNCSSSNEAVQMLSSAKLSLKGVLTKIKQEQTDISKETVVVELTSTVDLLEVKLSQVIQEIQHVSVA